MSCISHCCRALAGLQHTILYNSGKNPTKFVGCKIGSMDCAVNCCCCCFLLLSWISTPANMSLKKERGKRSDRAAPVHLHQYSSPVEAINLTVESQSLPVEVNQ